ncbi:MAG: TIGR00297 family protein [Methanomicrobiales archaeon]|nr:TIGR00297 family protein [Methanomicrobiales archaeon]
MAGQLGIWLATILALLCIVTAPFIQPPWVLTLLVVLFSALLYLIQGTKYVSISLILLALLYGAGLLPLFIFTATIAIVVVGEVAFRLAPKGVDPFFAFITASAGSLLFIWAYMRTITPLIALMGVLVAVLLKSALKDREDALMIEGLAVAMTMWIFWEINFPVGYALLLSAILIASTFGFFSYHMKVADRSGLFSGALVGVILIVFTRDVRWFLIMLAFFILGSAATRYRYDYKLTHGIAQSHGGVRGYYNVFANGLVAIAAAVLFGLEGESMWIALFLGSVATAAADTVAGEIGMTANDPYLITTFKPVKAGTNGGVTILGEAAGFLASAAVVLIAYLLRVITSPGMIVACTLAGFVGTQIDSVIGATLENRKLIGNAGTNLIATLLGGLTAMGLAYILV